MMWLVSRAPPAVCMAVALCVSAQPAQAQQVRTRRIRFEAGYSSNHAGSDKSIGGAVRFGISREPDVFRLETGLIAGAPYLGLDAGLEVRFPRRASLGMVLRAGGGLLIEDGYIGVFVRGGGGVEFDLSPRVALRATAQAGSHGGDGGPHHLYLGLDYRR